MQSVKKIILFLGIVLLSVCSVSAETSFISPIEDGEVVRDFDEEKGYKRIALTCEDINEAKVLVSADGEVTNIDKRLNGTYDVDDYVTGLVRTSGPTITFNGAWAQNIGVSETYIDFLGDKGGIRLQYGASFKIYSAKNGALMETTP